MARPISASLLVLAAASLLALTTAMSIESEPVKVTHRNSGPRYDIDEAVERTRMAAEQPDRPLLEGQPRPNQEASPEADSVGHISIRRIFLVPMMPAPRPSSSWQSESESESEASEAPGREQQNSFAARPFFPFMTPARPPPHLLGGDEASRSPSEPRPTSTGVEHETESSPGQPVLLNPLQMMIDLMNQALQGQLMPPQTGEDLDKEAASSGGSRADGEGPDRKETAMKPVKNQTETMEDIVEIEGKKFLRKTIINRHVGENIVFMTKRLIFVPLNETSSETTIAPTAVETTSSTTSRPSESSPELNEKQPARPLPEVPVEEPTSTTTTTESSTKSGEPIAPEVSSSVPSISSTQSAEVSTSSSPSEETTTAAKESWVDRVSEAVDKTAVRIVKVASSTSTTEKPLP